MLIMKLGKVGLHFSHPTTVLHLVTPVHCQLIPCMSVPLGYDNAMTFGHVAVLCACWVGQHVQLYICIYKSLYLNTYPWDQSAR